MKILIVRTYPNIINIHQYNMQEIGLAKALIRKGHECGIVIYNGKDKDEVEYITFEYNDIEKQIVLYKLHGFNILKNGFFPSLGKIVKDYDLIQVHEYDQITSWLYYAWSHKPVVVYHGPYYHDFNKGYNFKCKIFDSIFLRLKQNKEICCLTKSDLAADFLKRKGFENVTTVGVGLDIDNFHESTDSDVIPVDETKINIIYVGKIEERRNIPFLINVMKELVRNNKNVNCIVIGNGERHYVKNMLKNADELIRTGKLQYYEKANQKQLADIYKKMNLLLFPSNYEILGMVLLEAAYFGLAVVSSKNGGSDILRMNGSRCRIMEEFELNSWVQASEELIECRDNTNVISKYNDKFTWDAIVDKFIDNYRKTMQREC